MPPKNVGSEHSPLRRHPLYRWCSLSLTLICLMDALHASKQRASGLAEERHALSSWEERAAPLAEGQRVFDSTVRLRLDAMLALSAAELGQRECSGANEKEPVRGRLDRAVVSAANEQLNLPMGAGSLLTVAGHPYLFCLEPHYHPPGGGIAPEGWHKGVTVYHAQTTKERRL